MKLDCGICERRIASWLAGEADLEHIDSGWVFSFEGGQCRIVISPLEARTLGCVSIERCELAVEGDDAAIDEFTRLFMLRFASAGG